MTSSILSLDLGTMARKAGSGLSTLLNRLVSLNARYRNRQEVVRLSEFSDAMLHDIGLTRDDLTYAMRGGPFDDHSAELDRIAILRRSQTTIM